jgi:hypothetical protein
VTETESEIHVNANPSSATLQPGNVAPEESEIVNASDLKELVNSLSKRQPSNLYQPIARAIKHAAHGERFDASVARDMAKEIVKRSPFLNRNHLVTLLSPAFSLTEDISVDDFDRMLWAEQQTQQAEMARAKAATPRGSQPAGGQRTFKDIIVKADGVYYLRHPECDAYQLKLKDDAALRLELADRFGEGNAVLNLIDSAGRMYPTEKIMQWYGCNAHTIEKNFAVDATRFEFEARRLLIGHQMIPRELACFDEATHQWLTELAGGAAHIDELYGWIAATDQRYIGHPAAALAIVAQADTGKSLFAQLLAQTWGALPVKLSNAVQQFNASITRCPIWHADEEMPKELTGHEFRDLVAKRDRLYEPKGQEKVLLLGAPRILITVNELVDIRIRGANGPDAIKAIGDRLSIFTPTLETPQCLRALEVPGTHGDVDLPRMVRHLRWVQCEIEPKGQRFLGARADKAAARAQALRNVYADCPKVFDLLGDYLTDPLAVEKNYHLEERTFSTGGQRFPIITWKGSLYVRMAELVKALAPLPQERIEKALSAIPPADRELKRVKLAPDANWYYRPLDAQALLDMLSFDAERRALAEAALATSTQARCPALKPAAAPAPVTA